MRLPRLLALALTLALLSGNGVAQDQPAAAPRAIVGPVVSEHTRTIALRLRPGQDLRVELLRAIEAQGIEAASVVTCVGSLTKVTLRYANQPQGTVIEGHHLEIVSLVGTLSKNGSHLHLAVSDETGATLGGHLVEGSSVYTTAEVVLLVCDDLRFKREPDPDTTYNELVIEKR